MQRLWSITNRSWLASTPTNGSRPVSSKWVRPSVWAWDCSSQLLFATHTEQMWLRSTKSISMIVRRWSSRRAERVTTSMPSVTSVTHAATGRFAPATSTQHSRQAATSESPSRWHSVGISMAFSRATWRIV
jgi:hypothetical protein